jgi:1-deoxy-D-xylulose-5-phosphate synthase
MVLMAPKDENELRHMIYTAVKHDGPIAVRYPRGNGFGVPMDQELQALPIGKAEVLRSGRDVAIVAYGNPVHAALAAADLLAEEGVSATVVNARFAKPVDEELLTALAHDFSRIITLEEGAVPGGFGDAVLEFYALHPELPTPQVHIVGLPDEFIEHGPQALWRDQFNLSTEGIVREVKARFPELASPLRAAVAVAGREK